VKGKASAGVSFAYWV